MNLDEYLKQAAKGAPITTISYDDDITGPLVAHCWPVMMAGRPGWEFVIADYHDNLLGQGATAGTTKDRDQEVAAAFIDFERRVRKASRKQVA